ncbi:uncharacterized protein METZ01_LOCUS483229 [marine metagenome]|uniref:Uncharacterized protein n=1 Tax=marine metagenome TaxID=408172 RepID=A0A383CFB0_9ZZZZ
MCVGFGLSAILQYNDPDPLVWGVSYGIVAFFALAHHLKMNIDWKFYGLFTGFTLVWGILLGLTLDGTVTFFDLFEEFQMKDPTVEIGREIGGLILMSLWTAVLTVTQYRRRK